MNTIPELHQAVEHLYALAGTGRWYASAADALNEAIDELEALRLEHESTLRDLDRVVGERDALRRNLNL